ncbi:G-protein coupled receptor family C group 5 member B [Labeo rohita]|uniref:G-protein coupled receptor family C group 5 member B n=1 Tax=Labeo rohita TaxID=84645 RepID=A0ABQ8MZW0_LABRO|nr:G-protein coupled receptor family C group 5 member B [Labeo rohita]
MALKPTLVFILFLIGCCALEDAPKIAAPPPPHGCGATVDPPYRVLCDLESVWGVVLEAIACGGTVSALILAVVLLAKLKTVTEPEKRCGVGPLLLLLAGTMGLFSLSLVFLVGRGEVLCMVRRGLWGALFAMCFSCLLVQGVRLKKLAGGRRSPAGSSLAGLAFALTLVQGIIAGEWLLLTVVREGHAACDYLPLDFVLVCSYALALLLAASMLSLAVVLCGGSNREESSRMRMKWRCNAVWLFLACLSSLLLWVAWLGLYLYGDAGITTVAKDWDEPALAVALVTEGWVLLLFHAIPETHLCLRQSGQRNAETSQNYYDTPQPQTAQILQTGGYHNGLIRPAVPFRSHVYQPTEMALLMNAGQIPTAPPNFTGRHLCVSCQSLRTASCGESQLQGTRGGVTKEVTSDFFRIRLERKDSHVWQTIGMAVDGVSKEKKKKKKLKVEDVQDAGDTNVMVCHDVSVQTIVKKEEPLDTNIRDGEKWESDAGEKKKKKKKKLKEETEADSVCCDASVQTAVKTEHSDVNISDAPEKTKKKKKKKIKQEAEQIQEDGDHLVSKKKKAKKQGYEDEVEGIKKKKKKKEVEVKEDKADLGHSVDIVKKKKKKRKSDDDVAEQEQNAELEDGEIKKKRKKQKEADECEEEEQKVKKKKKKKKSSGEEEPDETEEKSRKLKKKLQSVDEGESHPHANGGRKSSSDKKMKKKIKAVADDEEELVGKKKSKDDRKKTPEKAKIKKLKQEHYEAMVETESKTSDIVFLSEKPGNQDEVSIDQARRLALQRDIDKESQPKPTLGQWGTAQFDSSDRQAKFLRLMGGFKKSSQPLTGFAGRANMALGKEGQQTLQQGLLGEFERAQNRHMDFRNKGAGLGFAAPSNKKNAAK